MEQFAQNVERLSEETRIAFSRKTDVQGGNWTWFVEPRGFPSFRLVKAAACPWGLSAPGRSQCLINSLRALGPRSIFDGVDRVFGDQNGRFSVGDVQPVLWSVGYSVARGTAQGIWRDEMCVVYRKTVFVGGHFFCSFQTQIGIPYFGRRPASSLLVGLWRFFAVLRGVRRRGLLRGAR